MLPEQPAVGVPRGLAKCLKEGTQAAHTAAEQVYFVHEFVKGNIKKESYCQLIVNLHHIYQALEQELDKNSRNEILEPMYFPVELHRTAALAADILFFCGDRAMKPSDAAVQYAKRLHEVGATHPELLVAHAYTRYLGDLSGGRVLKRALLRSFQLSEDSGGAELYNFNFIADIKAFKNMYRERLDSLPAQDTLVVEMVAEANRSFELSRQLFIELDEQSNTPRSKALDYLAPSTNACKGKCATCPFAMLAASGAPMPLGHPKLQKAMCELSCQSCPLKLLGQRAPTLALFILPIVIGVVRTVCKVHAQGKAST